MANDWELHHHLIGQQGSRAALNTPVLVIDEAALTRNIVAMAEFAKARNLVLRPHAKTHKSVDIAKMQIAAGAVGVCCAKLGEAEALADGGIEAILITSPVVTPQAIERLAALHARIPDLRVVADNPENVAALARAMGGAGHPLPVVVDIDPGIRRTGVGSPAAALELARQIEEAKSLRFVGVQFYCGAQQHIESYPDRRGAIEERSAYLRGIVQQLRAEGLSPEMISGGGTGTHYIDAELGVLNELQVGSYVFMDRQYNDCELRGEGGTPFETALQIDTRIVSANSQSMATIDAGFKSMATDGGAPSILAGAPAAAMFVFMGDEHGALIAPEHPFRIGDLVTLAAPHCDPTVNLYDYYHVVRDGALVAIWPVSARGRSR